MSIENTPLVGSLVTLLILAGCSPVLEDGRFTCGPTIDCPAGFSCGTDMLCYRPRDGAVTPMEAGNDAPARDATGGDAGRDGCGPNCVQIIVLNADPGSSGNIEFFDNMGALQRILIPEYGRTSATIDVPNVTVPGTLTVNVPPTLTLFHDLDVSEEGRYLLVLGPSSAGSSVQLLRQPPALLHTDGYVYLQLLDMTTDETVGLIATGAGRDPAARMIPNEFNHTMPSDPSLPFLPGSTGALRIAINPSSPQPIAALLADQIPATEGTYYVAVSGRVNAHLGADDGLRFIPGIPSSTALQSGRLVRFVNTVGTMVSVCDGATLLTTVPAGNLSAPLIPTTSLAWSLTVRTGSDCATGSAQTVLIEPAVGRTLVSIAGELPTAWRAVSISEPIPPLGVNSTIVIHNGLAETADIATATMVPSLGTASAQFVALPANITSTSATFGTRTFSWSPSERQSWVVVTFPGGLTLEAFEIDSPFTTAWTSSRVTSD